MSAGCEGKTCKSKDCPCPLCHGDPKKWLGGIHGGVPDHKTGKVKCKECGRVT
jgi:hypothetical protein